jgi:hypothetical protein
VPFMRCTGGGFFGLAFLPASHSARDAAPKKGASKKKDKVKWHVLFWRPDGPSYSDEDTASFPSERGGGAKRGGGQSCFRGLLGIGARMLTDCLHC